MKRILSLLVTVSFIATSCVGNASSSLWGKYPTPTPMGYVPPTVTSTPAPIASQTPTALNSMAFVEAANVSPTSTIPSEAFVTPESTSAAMDVTSTNSPSEPVVLYYAQSGDWLPAVAKRFGVEVSEITSPKPLPDSGLLDEGTLLMVPDRRDNSIQYTSQLQIIPDSEVVFSPTALGFDVSSYVKEAGGYLASYREYLKTSGWTTGAGAIERNAYENSVNPRLLLAILDYEAHWVRGRPENEFRTDFPLGYESYKYKGVFMQLVWGINQLLSGYYDWRTGDLTHLTFNDGTKIRIDPTLNAGTVAVMYYFSRLHSFNEWLRIMDQTSGFASYYQNMFGDPWSRAEAAGPLFPPSIEQPQMALPFEINSPWVFIGGPHGAWEHDGPLAALDFAPATDKTGCVPNPKWIVASAPGLVVRSGQGVVVVDLDGDGSEQTGWNIMYLHVANHDRVAKGQWVEVNDHIGHASCEGGTSTGTHLHIARKYNGEWILADGPLPMILSGWRAVAGNKPYEGMLIKGDKTIMADLYGQSLALIYRDDDGE